MTWRGRWCCGAAPSTRARASPPAICWPPCAAVGVASGSPGRRLRRRPCCAAAAAGRSSHPPTKPATLTFKRQSREWRCAPCRSPGPWVNPPGSGLARCWPRSARTWSPPGPLRCTPRWATRSCPYSSPAPTGAPAALAPGAPGRASIPASPAGCGRPPPTRPWCGAGGALGAPLRTPLPVGAAADAGAPPGARRAASTAGPTAPASPPPPRPGGGHHRRELRAGGPCRRVRPGAGDPAGRQGAQGPQRRAQPGRVQAGPARPRRPPGPRPGVRRAPRRRHRRRVGAGPQRPHDRQGDDRGPRQAAGHPRTTGAAAAMTQPPALRLAPDRLEYGPDGVPWPTTPMDQPTSNRHSHRNGNGHHPAQPPGRPFVPVDLAELARQGVPAPELVCHRLLYRGGLHSLAGPPDCGKSTLLYLWALELLAQGQRVVLLDEESGREQVTEKLLALGATPELLAPDRLIYQDFPARTWDHADHQALAELLERTRPALLGLDSAGAFLA